MTVASVRIAAHQPMLRAGLERIARAADLALSESHDADFVLRAFDTEADDAELDVSITAEAIVVTCRAQPAPEVWLALLRVIDAAALD